MAIQTRRGNEEDFDPTRLVPGEWAAVLDGKKAYLCFGTGEVKRMATYDDFEADMVIVDEKVAEASESATSASGSATTATEKATAASNSASAAATSASNASSSASTAGTAATTASEKATLSESWAVGGTSSRTGENTNNAKYWSEQAQAAAGGGVTSVNGQTGSVTLNAGDVGALPDSTAIPRKTSDLTNDSNYVSDASYVHTDNNYTGTEKSKLNGIEAQANKTTVDTTFSQTSTNPATSNAIALWVADQIANNALSKEIVQTLPTTNISTSTIYLVPRTQASANDIYNEYINLTGTTSGWEFLGSTAVDMSQYYTQTQVNNLFLTKALGQTKIKAVTNKTISVANVVTNTDAYASTYPYKADITVSGMTTTMKADICFDPASDISAVGSHINCFSGLLRVYFTGVPSASITVANISYWEVG